MIRPSQLPVTMTSKPAQGFMDSASPSQMLGVEGALGPAAPLGRHMPGALPRYPHSEALQYAGPYYSYRLCGQEGGGGDPPPAWSPSLAYLGSNSGSPVMPPAIAEGSIKSPIVYRQEKVLPPASSGGSPLPVAQELGAKRRYAGYYPDRDQGKCRSPSVVTPVVVRRQSLTGANLCSQADSPVGLAIPKPLYGHNSCCSDSRCTAGHSYSVEQGLHRMPPNVYEDEWLIGYAPSRKDLEMLLDQRGLHAEPSAEVSPGKEVAAEEYCGMDMHLNRRVPTYGEAGHSGYACSPTNGTTFIGIPPEPCQRLQFSSREYPGLPPSHSHMYDPAALARYRIPPKEYPHAPRYVQVPQRSRVYYTQEHMEAEKASVRADVREKYSDRTPSLSPGRRDACPSSPAHCSLQQHIPPVFANPPMHCHMHLPRHHFPPRNFDHPAYHPYQLHLNGGHPKAAPMRPPSHPLPSNLDNPLDYSLHRGQPGSSPRQPGSSPRQPGSSPRQPGSSPRQFPVSHSLYSIVPHTPLRPEHRSPNHVASVKTPLGHYMEGSHFSSDVNEKYGASDKHPSDFSGQKVHYRDLLAQPDIRRLLSTRDKISSDDEDVYEVEVTTKKRKVEMDHEAAAFPQVPASPPMPVINQVFSLAPYKLYLEAAGVLPPVKRQPPGKLKQDPEISEGSDLHDSVRGTKEITETMTIKNENKKMDLPNKEETEENHFCDRTFVKNKASNVASCTTAVKFPLKTDLEADNPSLEVTVPKYKVEVTSEHGAETTPSSHKSTKDATLEAKPAVKPSPPLVTLTPKLLPLPPKNPVRGNLQNIPPQCLKLTSFNIILPEALRTNVRLAPHAPNPLPAAPHSPALRTSVRPAPHAPNPLPAAPHSPALRTSVRPAPHAPNPLPAAPHSPALRTSVRPAPHPPNPLPAAPHSPAEPTPDGSIARQARHQFMEMHQSLCKLIYTFTTQTPPQELQGWLSKMELVKTLYPPDKHQKVSCLVGVKAREVWERAGERSLALQKVLSKLKGYHASGGCPFPHVMRAGGVFIPMLVVREGLFPQVQGTFIDQVLQEHRVELRPTTLSEEKYLTQLQKRACSSKLRRLLSFRHLPDIYADVLNLFYYTCVCKVLDSTSQGAAKKTPQGGNRVTGDLGIRGRGITSCALAPPTPHRNRKTCQSDVAPDEPIKAELEDLPEGTDTLGNPPHSCGPHQLTPEGHCFTVKQEPEERDIDVPSGTISGGAHNSVHKEERENVEEQENVEESKNIECWTIVTSLAGGGEEVAWEVCSGVSAADSREGLNIKVEVVQEEEEEQQEEGEEEEEVVERPWGGPVSSDEMPSGVSDAETDSVYTPSYRSSSSSSSSSAQKQVAPRSHSGMILKLRKVVCSEGGRGRVTLYQTVSDLTEPAVEEREEAQACKVERHWDGDKRRNRDRDKHQKRDRDKVHNRDRDKVQKRDRDKVHKRDRDKVQKMGRDKVHKRDRDESRGRERRRRRREREQRKKRREERSRFRRERRRKRLLRARAFSPPPSPWPSHGRLHRSALPKIRFCPYLSTCHSSDRRRRWVLRSAVQSARQAMQSAFPDLVGKRIRHLYEETDRSEAWYRGVVLRVHEAHPNPLKTVFEVKYDSEPEWQYFLELLIDFQKGWLKVEDF